jgi:hypothetical protein
MKRHSDAGAAAAFCASRLENPSRAFGTLEVEGEGLKALARRAHVS